MAEIHFRVRGPGWTETVSLAEDKTLEDLQQWIFTKRDIRDFQLKYGFPPKTIDSAAKGVTLKELNLKGETLTLVPAESAVSAEAGSSQPPMAMPTPQRAESFKPKPVDAESSDLEWPEKGGYLVLRVMPDDNSCMFTAFGGVIPLQDPARALRKQVADYILEHNDKYNSVVLEMAPPAYAQKIQDPMRWGGAIELSILSDIYDIEICSVDVKSGRVDRYGEGKATRCILVYSGIHYDRITFTLGLDLPVEWDETKWSTDNDEVIDKARELCKNLQKAHYYTDFQEMVAKCQVPGCDWIGQGQKSMTDHTKATGHAAFGELVLD